MSPTIPAVLPKTTPAFPCRQVRALVSGLVAAAALAQTATGPPSAQGAEPESLTIEKAIDRALTRSIASRQQKLTMEAAELSYQDAWDQFFLPSIGFTFSSSSAYTVARLPGTKPNYSTYNYGYPATSAAINLGQYTIFNFWKDYLTYQQARTSYDNAKLGHHDWERTTRNQVIGAFYRYRTDQEKVDAAKRSLDISGAIAELIKSRVKLGQATQEDVNSSQVDLLNAKNAYSELVQSVKNDLWALNQQLGDPIDTPYKLEGSLKFVAIHLTVAEALKIYYERSPQMRGARDSIRSAEIALELAEKSRLPLPTITFSGLSLALTHGYYGGTSKVGTDAASGSNNFDIGMSLSLSLPLLGPGGLFNNRSVQQARNGVENARMSYLQTVEQAQVTLYGAVGGIKQSETQVENMRKAYQSSAEVLDGIFSKISSGKVNRLELRDALVQARNSQIDLADAILGHVQAKLSLAEQLGIDSLPGDSY